MAPAQADAGVGMAVDAQFSVDRQHWIVSPKRFSYTRMFQDRREGERRGERGELSVNLFF